MKKMNILFVEDDEIDIKSLERAFKKKNIANPLFIARNGLEALEMLKGENGKEKIESPRFIILDINMPKMNGLEFLKEIRNDKELKSLSVVVLTTSDRDKDKMEAYDLNVAGYILKPMKIEDFINVASTINKYWTLCEVP